MKKYITLLLPAMLFASCFDDKGNYDYHEINATTIEKLPESYTVFADVGTLSIDPAVSMTLNDPDDPRFEYLWIATGQSTGSVDTIGRTRKLDWTARLPMQIYALRLRVIDKQTGIVEKAATKLTLTAYHTRGLMLIGENAQGKAQAQMITMIAGQSETFYDNILEFSGLPELTGPIDFFHTGTSYVANANALWLVTQSGTYFMNRSTLKAEDHFNVFGDKMYFEPDAPINPVEIAPRIKAADNSLGSGGIMGYRFYLCSNGEIYGTWLYLNGDTFDQPINIVQGQSIFLQGPMLYAHKSYQNCLLLWDRDNNRFVKYGSGIDTQATLLTDPGDAIFPYDQNEVGRTYVYGENTFNADGGAANGNSFAIMRQVEPNGGNYDYCIYKMYCNAAALRQGFYTVDRTEAPLFGSATSYAFSSKRTVVFYVAAGKLYAYDYDPTVNRNYEIALADAGEVTMAKFDIQREPEQDFLYVATYESGSGTLAKYAVDADLNSVKLASAPSEKWTGLAKIKNMSWRGGE